MKTPFVITNLCTARYNLENSIVKEPKKGTGYPKAKTTYVGMCIRNVATGYFSCRYWEAYANPHALYRKSILMCNRKLLSFPYTSSDCLVEIG